MIISSTQPPDESLSKKPLKPRGPDPMEGLDFNPRSQTWSDRTRGRCTTSTRDFQNPSVSSPRAASIAIGCSLTVACSVNNSGSREPASFGSFRSLGGDVYFGQEVHVYRIMEMLHVANVIFAPVGKAFHMQRVCQSTRAPTAYGASTAHYKRSVAFSASCKSGSDLTDAKPYVTGSLSMAPSPTARFPAHPLDHAAPPVQIVFHVLPIVVIFAARGVVLRVEGRTQTSRCWCQDC